MYARKLEKNVTSKRMYKKQDIHVDLILLAEEKLMVSKGREAIDLKLSSVTEKNVHY